MPTCKPRPTADEPLLKSNDDFFGGVSGSQLTNKSIFCSGQQLLDCFVFNSICLPNNVKMYSWIEALNKNALCMDQ